MKTTPTLIALLFLVSPVRGADWPQLRGPFFNGSTDVKDLPSDWTTTENVAWIAELPGPSAATPGVWKDHVFVSSTEPETDTLKALCFDRKTGARLWQHDVSKGIKRDTGSTYAAPSPATDGEVVVFFYGNGELVAFNFSGKKLWGRNIARDYGEFAFLWTFASSPVLYGGKLFLQVLQRDMPVDGRGVEGRENESYLLALDPKTGTTLWRHVRRSAALVESREAFTTPLPFERGSYRALLIAGADVLTGHDPQTGEELWRWGTWNPERLKHRPLVPSPVAGGDVVLVCGSKRDPVYAIRVGATGRLGDESVVWVSRDERAVSSDVPTPAFYDGDFFVLSDVRKSLSRVEPGTGKVKWTMKTPGLAKYEASPLAADGKIYLINFDGEVVIVDASDGRFLKVISMEATKEFPVRSAVVAAQGQLFIRTNRKLFCVGRK